MNRRRSKRPASPDAAPKPVASKPTRSAAPRVEVPRERFAAWREQHLYSFWSSLGRLWQRRYANLLTLLVLAFALSLPLAFRVAYLNAQVLGEGFSAAREIGVFTKPRLDSAAIRELVARLRQRPEVSAVSERTPAQGLADLKALPGFEQALAELPDNPLPTLLIVTPVADASAADLNSLATSLRSEPSVDAVELDLTWRERLTGLLALGARLGRVLAVLFGVGALLVVGNTVRLDVAQRADEIAVVQLLGGTRGFVRRPYLYLGCWYGLAAAWLALLAVQGAALALSAPVDQLVRAYGGVFQMHGPDFMLSIETVLAGIVLGWIGAFVATSHYLIAADHRN